MFTFQKILFNVEPFNGVIKVESSKHISLEFLELLNLGNFNTLFICSMVHQPLTISNSVSKKIVMSS